MKTQSTKLPLTVLFHAPWNPRGEITPESVADLTASIKERGLLQDIGVWRDDETNAYFVIYGNRRFVACREAGYTDIPVKLYECSKLTAQELTRIENEVRLGVDPLKDAELLSSMCELGFTQEEIAAHFALPLATVCRRLKLNDLAPCFREAIEKGAKITTDALERLSAYPADIQAKAAKVLREDPDDLYRWSYFEYIIQEATHDLDCGGVCFDKCRACTKRTGAQLTLFGDLEEGEELGCCLDSKCYEATRKEDIERKLAELITPEATERKQLKNVWDFRNVGADKKKPDAKNICAYYVVHHDGKIEVNYGPSKDVLRAKAKREKEDKEAKKKVWEEKERKRLAVYKLIRAWVKESGESAAKEYIGDNPWKVVDLMIMFSNPYYGDIFGAWKKSRTFGNWFNLVGKDCVFSRFETDFMSPRAVQILVTTFSNVKWDKVFTKDQLKFIKSKTFLL